MAEVERRRFNDDLLVEMGKVVNAVARIPYIERKLDKQEERHLEDMNKVHKRISGVERRAATYGTGGGIIGGIIASFAKGNWVG